MRRSSLFIATCVLLILFSAALPPYALADFGTPTVTPGSNPNALLLGAIRYQSLVTNKQDAEIYLGMPSLGATADRTQKSVTWAAENDITFRYDKATNKLVTSIQNSHGYYELFYASFSNKLATFRFGSDTAAAASALSALNYFEIIISRGESDPANISLANFQLNGQPLGSFPGAYGTQTWKVEGFDFTEGFVLTGKVLLNNVTLSGEVNKIDIIFGHLDLRGPLVTNVVVSPVPTHIDEAITLTALVSEETSGRAKIASAEWSLDSGLTWQPMQAQDGAYDEMTEEVTAALTAPGLVGTYPICVRGTDTRGNLGAEQCIVLNALENQAPQVSLVQFDPAPVPFEEPVRLTALVDDSSTGASLILSAEFSLDGGLTWTSLGAEDGLFDTTTESVAASFTAPAAAGTYSICVRGTDQALNVSTAACQDLTVLDAEGPAVQFVSLVTTPVYLNSSISFTGLIDDGQSGGSAIAAVDWSLDGGQTWQPVPAQDGAFDSVSETVSIELAAPVAAGSYSLCLRGADAPGNENQVCTPIEVIDNLPASISMLSAAPNPVPFGQPVNLFAQLDDRQHGASNLVSAEWSLDGGQTWQPLAAEDGAFDSALEEVSAEFLAPQVAGEYTVCVRYTDQAGNTGSDNCLPLTVSDDYGPQPFDITVAPLPVKIGLDLVLTAQVGDSQRGGSAVVKAEYKLDGGSWQSMQAADGAFDSVTEAVDADLTAPGVSGSHTICVRGTDAAGNTGEEVCIQINAADHRAPVVSQVAVSTTPAGIGKAITLQAMVADGNTGQSTILSASYSLDEGKSWLPMQAKDGAFDEASEVVVTGITAPGRPGDNSLCVRGSDAAGNTSAKVCITLRTVDDLRPEAALLTLSPQSVAAGQPVTVTAQIDDAQHGDTAVAAAELSLDEGKTWQSMQAEDGAFNETIEKVLGTLTAPDTAGTYQVCVRGSDAAGNRSASSCAELEVTAPPSGNSTLYIPIIFNP